MRKYIALIIIVAILAGGAIVEHCKIVKRFEQLVVDAEVLQVQLRQLEDNVQPPAHILHQAENIEKQFSKSLPIIEAMVSHNCLKDLKIKIAEVIAALEVKAIKDASMQLQTVITMLNHMGHLGKFKIQHLF